MKIRQIEDNDPELYSLIAPLVMNPKVLKSNNNYPFKNFSGTVWYIAMEDSDISGFMPLKKNNTGFHIVKISPFSFIFHHSTHIRKSLYYSVF